MVSYLLSYVFHAEQVNRCIDRSQVPRSIDVLLPMPEANTTGPVNTKDSTCIKETHARGKHDHEFQRKNMSYSGKIRVPVEEYVIYYPPTDQSDSLNCSIIVCIYLFGAQRSARSN